MSDEPIQTKPAVNRVALTEHDALPAGTRFGEFEIIRMLGVGGFGIVYLAQDHSLERQVALKEYMPASLAARGAGAMITIRSGAFAETFAMGLRSFINEARLLARFDHPSLVKVYRFWEDNGTAYMVMPYLEGRTLRDARRAMSQAPAEAWIRGVLDPLLDAVELLHREGVFHRDIAPDNILLPPGGAPILLDFGAARRVISDRTQSLTAILKPSYAPIEQYAEMTAMRQGPWTDIYALGAMLHFLLFGVPPAPATARAVQPDDEQIEQRVVPGVSPRFMSVVAWMLGVRPLDRPQNVASLRAALDGHLPIPSSTRRDVTVPGDTALMPVASAAGAPPTFAPTMIEPAFERTMRVEGSAYAAPTQLDPAYQPTALTPPPMPAPSPAASAAAPAARVTAQANGPAPMRSTPPGTPLPSYVPPRPLPAAAASPAAVTPPTVVRPARRMPLVVGGLAALAVAAAVLWQFVGVIGRQRSAAPSPSVAASMPPGGAAVAGAGVASAGVPGAYTGPTVTQVASVPQWGNGPPPRPAPALVAPVLPAAVESVSAAASTPPVPAANRPRPKPAAVRASDAGVPVGVAPVPEVRAPRVAAARSLPEPGLVSGEPLVAQGPHNAREACGDRKFIALAVCMDRECERPRFRDSAECVRLLDIKRRRQDRASGNP